MCLRYMKDALLMSRTSQVLANGWQDLFIYLFDDDDDEIKGFPQFSCMNRNLAPVPRAYLMHFSMWEHYFVSDFR